MKKASVLLLLLLSVVNGQFDGDEAYDDLCSKPSNRRANMKEVVACSDGSYNGCDRDPRCCWDPSTNPRCYFKAAYIPSDKCTVNNGDKVSCISETARSNDVDNCLKRTGCCYNITGVKDVPDCYYEKKKDVEAGYTTPAGLVQRCTCAIHDDPFVQTFDSLNLPILESGRYVAFASSEFAVIVDIGPPQNGIGLELYSLEVYLAGSDDIAGAMRGSAVTIVDDAMKDVSKGDYKAMEFKDIALFVYEGSDKVQKYTIMVDRELQNEFGACGSCDGNYNNDYVVHGVDYSTKKDRHVTMMRGFNLNYMTGP